MYHTYLVELSNYSDKNVEYDMGLLGSNAGENMYNTTGFAYELLKKRTLEPSQSIQGYISFMMNDIYTNCPIFIYKSQRTTIDPKTLIK
jgi:hypothetical protein